MHRLAYRSMQDFWSYPFLSTYLRADEAAYGPLSLSRSYYLRITEVGSFRIDR